MSRLTCNMPKLAFWLVFMLIHNPVIIKCHQNSMTLMIEHKFGSFDEFKPRGSIKLSGPNWEEIQLNDVDSYFDAIEQFELAKDDSSLYCVRTKAFGGGGGSIQLASSYSTSCISICLLVLNDLRDHLTLSLTNEQIVGLSIQIREQPNRSSSSIHNFDSCRRLDQSIIVAQKFNTTIRIVQPVDGPTPETQAFLQKIEQEKREKAHGEQTDNRSFIAKYWMYIVPVVIVVMLSGAINPEAAAQQAAATR